MSDEPNSAPPSAVLPDRGGMVAREIRRRRTRLLAAAVLVAVLASVVAAVVFQSPPVVAFAVFVLVLQAASFLALALVVTSLRRAVRRLEKAMDKATEMARDQVIREVTHNVAGQISELHGSLLNDLQALEQLIARYEPTATLPLVGGWAMSPTGLIWLVDQIERARPSLVVECGSGTSTLWMSLALRRAGTGRLVALEHVEEYAQQTRQLLERHGVADWAEVRHAPLTATDTPRGSFPWYELDSATLTGIDLLLVDGPPGSTGRHARYPALHVLAGSLAPGATIVVDDSERADESKILDFWLAEDERLRRDRRVAPGVDVLRRT